MPRTEVTFRQNTRDQRIEAVTDSGEVAGYSEYDTFGGGDFVFFHTEVETKFEGHGIGGQIAAGVMEFVRGQGKKIAPTCPFLNSWMKKHPEHHDLLVEGFALD